MVRRAPALLFLAAFAVYALSPARQNYDSYLAHPTARQVLHERTLSLDELVHVDAVRHHHGLDQVGDRAVNWYPWTVSLLLVPAVATQDLAHAAGIGDGSLAAVEEDRMDTAQAVTASAVAAAVVVVVHQVARQRLRAGSRHRRAVPLGVALVLAFGTSLWSTASRAMWQHGPSLLALAVAAWGLQALVLGAGTRRRAVAVVVGVATALAYTFRPTNAVFVVAATVFVARRPADRPWFAAGAAATALPWLAVNLRTFDALLPPYFVEGEVGLTADYPEALLANLVSPSRGLLVFTPVVALAALGLAPRFRRELRDGLEGLDRLLAACVVLHVLLVSASTPNWWGGSSYGPRFTSDALAFLAILAVGPAAALAGALAARRPAARWASAAVAAAVAWSAFTASQGAAVRATSCWNGLPEIDRHHERVWDWSEPQFAAGVARLASTGSLRATVLDDCTR